MPSRSRRTGGLTSLLTQRERLRDLAFLLGLSALAMVGFAPTFTGFQFFVVGVLGVLIGAGAAQLAHVRRWPAVAAILLTVAAFFLLGGPLCLRSEGASAYLPLPGTLGSLVDQLIFGWKDLLTTLPPVDGAGSSLVIPWVMGLTTGLVGALLIGAHRWRRLPAQVGVVLPLLAPIALLVGVILLGTQHAASILLQGVAFAAAALSWLALRSLALATRTGTHRSGFARRGLAGVALLGLASVLAWPIGTWLAGSEDDRVVLRSYVEPPFDIGDYPSPLAGFRRYVELPAREAEQSTVNLHDKTLFEISGVEENTLVRFAALEDYDGMVWRAAEDVDPSTSLDTYQRVSSTIDNPAEGEEVEVEVTLGEGYSEVWLPTVGAIQHLAFEGGSEGGPDRTEAVEDGFRYNLAASTGIVPVGLRPGDSYRFTAVLPDDSLEKTTEPSDELPPAYQSAAFLDTQANDWSAGETEPMARVFAAAEKLKTDGRFSDGVAANEKIYHAGHNQKRLGEEFVNFPIMAGNAEQYAATMALLANRIGVPARVVMGAKVPEDGVVTGAQVTAWVELQAADGTWRTLPTEAFMGKQKPADQPPQQQEEMSGSVVPPPAPIPPPSTEGEQTDTELKTRSEDEDDSGWSIPRWLQIVLLVVGSPLLLLALVLSAILGAKAWRRRRRRTRGLPSARIGGGWRELVDSARDLGHSVPVSTGLTRREQAHVLDTIPAHELARAADGHVFGPITPGDAEVTAYWQRVDEQRAAMRSAENRWTRFRAMLSLRTFRRRWSREPDQIAPRSPAAVAAEDPRNKHGHQLVDPS